MNESKLNPEATFTPTFETVSLSGSGLNSTQDFITSQMRLSKELVNGRVVTDLDDNTRDKVFHTFDLTMNGASVFKEVANANKEKSFVTFAMNGEKIIGLIFFLINDSNQVINAFSGVTFDYTRKGIATKLIAESHKELKKKQIHSYSCTLQPYSLKAIQKVVGEQNVTKHPEIDKLYQVNIVPKIA